MLKSGYEEKTLFCTDTLWLCENTNDDLKENTRNDLSKALNEYVLVASKHLEELRVYGAKKEYALKKSLFVCGERKRLD